MSVSFYGKAADGKPIFLDLEDRAYLNMSNMNACAFLQFIELEQDAEGSCSGEASMPDARRAVMKSRALFARRVAGHIREASSSERFYQGGIDADYFVRRLDDFEVFLNAVVEKGAVSIYWA